MLVLTRGPMESVEITVGDTTIIVTFLGIRGNVYGRIGITAPENCNIRRTELPDRRIESESMSHVTPNGLTNVIRENLEQAAKPHRDHTPND